jgi:hypothetical protein
MAYFCELDEYNRVMRVIVVCDTECIDEDGNESEEKGIEYLKNLIGDLRWKKTSYNTRHNRHFNGKTPYRKNFAQPGYTYDNDRDAFIPPRIFPSWIFDEEACDYFPPIPYPDDGKRYYWDENALSWTEEISDK